MTDLGVLDWAAWPKMEGTLAEDPKAGVLDPNKGFELAADPKLNAMKLPLWALNLQQLLIQWLLKPLSSSQSYSTMQFQESPILTLNWTINSRHWMTICNLDWIGLGLELCWLRPNVKLQNQMNWDWERCSGGNLNAKSQSANLMLLQHKIVATRMNSQVWLISASRASDKRLQLRNSSSRSSQSLDATYIVQFKFEMSISRSETKVSRNGWDFVPIMGDLYSRSCFIFHWVVEGQWLGVSAFSKCMARLGQCCFPRRFR